MTILTLGKKTCSSCYLEIGKNHQTFHVSHAEDVFMLALRV